MNPSKPLPIYYIYLSINNKDINSNMIYKYYAVLLRVVIICSFQLLLILTLFAPCTANSITTTYAGKKYLYMKDLAKDCGMSINQDKKLLILKNESNTMGFELDSKDAVINGVKVSLLNAVSSENNSPLISEEDLTYIIKPILYPRSTLKKEKVKTIIIDPGHGGKDTGTLGTKTREKDIVMPIAKKLAKVLTSEGYKVILTRGSDKFIPLRDRPGVISKYNGDLFISIHANHASNPDTKGFETFVLAPQGTASTYSKEPSFTMENGNIWNLNNELLGYEIQKALVMTGRENRSLKHCRFVVLRFATKPAILVETGFLSNKEEEEFLSSNSGQEKIAEALACGINEYAKIMK